MKVCWNFLATIALAMLFAGLSNAQATRTWVSGVGDDVNPCSRTAPCKTFAGAISKTTDGGEINCIDSGGFGAVTVTKSITIDCGPFLGGVLASLTNGIIINASASAVVILRNLEITGTLPNLAGAATGINGIRYLSAKSVHIENVHIAGFNTSCVDASTGATAGQLNIENSILEHCGANGVNLLTTTAVQINAQITNSQILGSLISGVTTTTNGINAQNGTRLVLDKTVIANVTTGINQVNSGGGAASNVFVVNSSVHNAATALKSVTGAFMGATLSGFYNCGTIFNINGGNLFTGSDNTHFNEALVGATTGSIGKV